MCLVAELLVVVKEVLMMLVLQRWQEVLFLLCLASSLKPEVTAVVAVEVEVEEVEMEALDREARAEAASWC